MSHFDKLTRDHSESNNHSLLYSLSGIVMSLLMLSYFVVHSLSSLSTNYNAKNNVKEEEEGCWLGKVEECQTGKGP